MENKESIIIPADVPENKQAIFTKNYNLITRQKGRLFLFSCDHKIEHLNKDFYGPTIHPQALHPEHLFRIAQQGNIGAMATHMGLIARYAKQYPNINYIIKTNGSTQPAAESKFDKKSYLLWNVQDIIQFKNNNPFNIPGIGITIYLGNEFESEHLHQAAQAINHAHKEGLVTIVWVYLQNKTIHQNTPELIAGAAGIGLSLGADFIKVKLPEEVGGISTMQSLKIAVAAAGNSKILCAGGTKVDHETYLQELHNHIHEGDTSGTATGRNIFQLSLPDAIALTNAISAIIYDNADYKTSLAIYNEKLTEKLP